MSNTKKVTISLTPEQQEKARSLSKDLFGKENISGLIGFLIEHWEKEKIMTSEIKENREKMFQLLSDRETVLTELIYGEENEYGEYIEKGKFCTEQKIYRTGYLIAEGTASIHYFDDEITAVYVDEIDAQYIDEDDNFFDPTNQELTIIENDIIREIISNNGFD